MKNTNVTLVPLESDDRDQFILDNQWAFKHGAMIEFGERDGHLCEDGEIISRKTIERCIDSPNSETYRIVVDGRKARDGEYVDLIGTYDPLKNPAVVNIDKEKAAKWIACGVQPTDTVKGILVKEGILEAKKAQAKAKK